MLCKHFYLQFQINGGNLTGGCQNRVKKLVGYARNTSRASNQLSTDDGPVLVQPLKRTALSPPLVNRDVYQSVWALFVCFFREPFLGAALEKKTGGACFFFREHPYKRCYRKKKHANNVMFFFSRALFFFSRADFSLTKHRKIEISPRDP